MLPSLLRLAQSPPADIDRYELNIGLVEAFGQIKAKEGIPFLIDHISMHPSLGRPNIWLKMPEAVLGELPAAAALVNIGKPASDAIIRVQWWQKPPEDRLAAIFVVSMIHDPDARAFLATAAAQANLEHSWAEFGLKLFDQQH